MITILLIGLVVLDAALLGIVLFMRREQAAHGMAIEELVEERKILEELRQAVHSDLEATQGRTRETMQKISKIAAEAEQEVKMGSASLAAELDSIMSQLSGRFEAPLKELSKKIQLMEKLVKQSQDERRLLGRALSRGEQLTGFFSSKIPYDEILSDIEDKKYVDARAMLAKGVTPESVAEELGMPIAEVRMVAGVVHP